MITKLSAVNPVNFGKHFINVDMGASKDDVSFKIRILDEKERFINYKEVTVFQEGDERSAESFEKNVARLIAVFDKTNREEIIKRTSKPYEPIVTVCCPGPPVLTRDPISGEMLEANNLPNVKLDRPVIGKNISDEIARLLTEGDFEFKTGNYVQAKDTDGTGVLVLETLLKEKPALLEEGRVILHLYPGGGLANGTIRVGKDKYILEGTEKPSIFEQIIGKPRIDKDDRSAKGLLKNFCTAMNIDEKYFNENPKVVTDYREFKGAIQDKRFSYSKKDWQEASWYAIDKLMDALASIAQIEICNAKTDTIVLVGPAINGARQAVNNLIADGFFTERYSDAACFEDIFEDKIRKISTDIRKKLGENFKLKTEFLNVKDNTLHTHKLQPSEGAEVVGRPASWYEIPKNKVGTRLDATA